MPVATRMSVKSRNIDAPLLSFKLQDEVRRLRREPEWKDGDKNGITLAKYPNLRTVLVTLKKGAHMREHGPEGPMSLAVISGKVELLAGGVRQTLERKGLATVRRGVRHDVRAMQDSVILLTIVWP